MLGQDSLGLLSRGQGFRTSPGMGWGKVLVTYVRLFAVPSTVARQVPLSMGFSLKCFPFPVPGNLPNPGMEPVSLMAPASAGGFFTIRAIWEAHCVYSNQKVQLRTDDDGGH